VRIAREPRTDDVDIAAFRDEDADITFPMSHGRYRDSLFGELEHDTERFRLSARDAGLRLAEVQGRLDAAHLEREAALAGLRTLRSSRVFRWSGPARTVWGGLRRRLRPGG